MDIIKRKCYIKEIRTTNDNSFALFKYGEKDYSIEFQRRAASMINLFILSDDEIKEGDLFYNATIGNTGIFTCKNIDNSYIQSKELGNFGINHNSKYCNKIIASTDPSLGLPSISQGFIEKYCQLGGIDKVMVEYKMFMGTDIGWYFDIKLNSKKEIIISKIKDSWNREEVEYLIKKITEEIYDDYSPMSASDVNNWIKNNI